MGKIAKVEQTPIATVDVKDEEFTIPENDEQREGMITDLSMMQLSPYKLNKCVCHAVQMQGDFDIALTRQRVVGPRGSWLVRCPGPAAFHFVVPDGAWQRMAQLFNPGVSEG